MTVGGETSDSSEGENQQAGTGRDRKTVAAGELRWEKAETATRIEGTRVGTGGHVTEEVISAKRHNQVEG